MTGEPLWHGTELGKALRAASGHGWQDDGVSIDSRTVRGGDLFIALKGARFDGHDFALEALARGAVAAMVEPHRVKAPKSARVLEVPSTARALTELGRAARARNAGRIVAVTGSVGKTGTKEMIRLALASAGPTFAAEGSLNNHVGVPLSLARLPRDAAFGVFEIGMNHAGEIRPLAQLLRPHVAVITTVEAVHLEAFASLEAIADAKAEIFDGLVWDGFAVLSRDNTQFDRLERSARLAGIRRIRSFGRSREAQAELVDYVAEESGGCVRARVAGKPVDYRLALPGAHWAHNSLAALAVAHALGVPIEPAAQALGAFTAMKGRGVRHEVALAGGTFTLIDESYNASPASVRAALATLALARGRRIAVLGDMLELGPDAARFHAELAPALDAAGVAQVFAAGPLMRALCDALPADRRGAWAPSAEELAPLVCAAVEPGDTVMVKGSASSRMGVVVEALRARAESRERRVAGGR